tara:strand:- start:343 stop:735 length:393 start_codon:yes stop_codon:yes gene_type:complete
MRIKPEYDLKYEELIEKIVEAKKIGLDTKIKLYNDAGFGLGVIKSKNGEVVNPILASEGSDPLETTEDAVKSGMYILSMAFAANGADDILDHPKFEKCVIEAMEKIPLFVQYVQFKEKLQKLDEEEVPRN